MARGRSSRRAWVEAAVSDLDPARDRASLVLVGAEAERVLGLQPPGELAGALDGALTRPLDPRGTDLGAALRAAGAVDELVLVSDGRDTAGGALAAAAELAAAGAALHAFGPDLPPPFGARLARLEAPAAVAPGERAEVEVEAQAHRPGRLTVTLELADALGVTEVGRAARAVAPGDPLVARFVTPPLPGPGVVTLRARVRAIGRDDDREDDVLEAAVRVGSGARALVVGEPPPGLAGVDVVRVEPRQLARALGQRPPDLVVLSETPAWAVAEAVDGLAAAVRAGTGLVVAGSGRAFGPGGYAESGLEALLPVTAGPGEERERPLAVWVALDASGSMAAAAGGRTRYARAVAAGLPVHLLRPGDRIGVAAFAAAPTVLHPLGQAPPDLVERVADHETGGATDVGAALVHALEGLAAAGADADLLGLVVSDSEDPDPTRHLERIRAAAAALPAERLEVRLVLIGAGEAHSLRTLAEAVGPPARVLRAGDAEDALRELVEGELLARRAARREGGFPVRPTAEGAARGLELPARVAAFAPVRPRDAAEVLARVEDPETDDPPLVVLGRRGLGRVLCVPAGPRVAGPALRALRDVLLPVRAEGVDLQAERADGGLAVVARGELPAGPLRVRLEPTGGGEARATPLVPHTPTEAAARLDRVPAAPLLVTLLGAEGGLLDATHVPGAGHAELARSGPDYAALDRLTRATGGQLLAALPAPERPLPEPPRAGAAAWPLAPWLALAALALLVLESGAGALRERLGARRAAPAPATSPPPRSRSGL